MSSRDRHPIRACADCGETREIRAYDRCHRCEQRANYRPKPIITCVRCGHQRRRRNRDLCEACYQGDRRGTTIRYTTPQPHWGTTDGGQSLAACARDGMSPDAWFTAANDSGHAAIRVCMACPVRARCLGYALDLQAAGEQVIGIWGGRRFGTKNTQHYEREAQ